MFQVDADDNDVIHDALMRHSVADDSAIPPVNNATLAALSRPRRMSGPASPAGPRLRTLPEYSFCLFVTKLLLFFFEVNQISDFASKVYRVRYIMEHISTKTIKKGIKWTISNGTMTVQRCRERAHRLPHRQRDCTLTPTL